jgi:DNA polymerase III delta prime subunit
MDECLDENEMVRVGTIDNWKPIKLKDLEFFKEYPIVSMDIDTGELFNDVGELISSKEDDVYEIELDDAYTIRVTKDHPIIVKNSDSIEQKTINKTLGVGDNVVFFDLKTKKIVSIKRVGYSTVRNLNVKSKHTFITKNGIVTHNCDGATLSLQQGLRSSIEQFHKVCRFIFTCNYVSKIIEPLRSRCQEFDMNFTDENTKSEMIPLIKKRMIGILKKKNIDFVEETIDNLVLKYYPDMRKMIQICQQYSNVNNFIDNNIFDFAKIDSELYKYILEKKFVKARTYIIQKNYNFSELYTDLYKNFVPRLPPQKQPNVIIVLADYQFKHSQVVDQEINFSACLLEIMSNI